MKFKFGLSKTIILFLIIFNYSYSKNLNCTYTYIPDTLYVNQIFSIKLECAISITEIIDIQKSNIKYKKNNSIKYYPKKITWIKNKNNFTGELYFKSLSTSMLLPSAKIELFLNNGDKVTGEIEQTFLKSKSLMSKNKYSNVLAKTFDISKYRFDKFDKNNNLILMHIKGSYLNASDFKINNNKIIKQEIRDLRVNLPYSDFIVTVVIPRELKKFEFSYFNLNNSKFENKKIDIKFENDEISTNTIVSPKLQNTNIVYILISLAIVFFALFYFRKKNIYIIIFILLFVYLFYILILSKESGTILKNSKVKILATQNSRIIRTISENISVEILDKQNGYFHIMLDNEQTGWTKVSNVIKN
jgi:hypothetical protein